MAREYPSSPGAFRRINGVGEKKLAELGPPFLEAIAAHVAAHGARRWDDAPARASGPKPLNDTGRETLRRLREGASVDEIAAARGLVTSTIWSHLAAAVDAGETFDVDRLVSAEQLRRAAEVFAEIGTDNLTGAVERLGFDFGIVRLCRAVLQRG